MKHFSLYVNGYLISLLSPPSTCFRIHHSAVCASKPFLLSVCHHMKPCIFPLSLSGMDSQHASDSLPTRKKMNTLDILVPRPFVKPCEPFFELQAREQPCWATGHVCCFYWTESWFFPPQNTVSPCFPDHHTQGSEALTSFANSWHDSAFQSSV